MLVLPLTSAPDFCAKKIILAIIIMDSNTRARSYCFTINNWELDDLQQIWDLDCFFIIGYEVGKCGTPHLQGYLHFNSCMRFTTLHKRLPRAHLEVAKGSYQQNLAYCSKDGDFDTSLDYALRAHHQPPQQGKRSDMTDIATMIFQKKSALEIMEEHPGSYIRYQRSIKEAISMVMPERTIRPHVGWIYGPTGSGKTYYAKTYDPPCYFKNGTKWWEGYHQQKTIIIDDFNSSNWDFRDLLRLLDENVYQGEIKGGHVQVNSPNIFITCDRPPHEVFKKLTKHELSQLLRRLHDIIFIPQFQASPIFKMYSNYIECPKLQTVDIVALTDEN